MFPAGQTPQEKAAWYEALGFACIPLKPERKEPLCQAWQRREPAEQWAEVAGGGLRYNLGIRTSSTHAVFDCDSRKTADGLREFLACSYGQRPIEVRTARGLSEGRAQFHVRLKGAPAGVSKLTFRRGFDGEVGIGPGSYYVAPGSTVAGQPYQLVSGRFEDLADVPALPWSAFSWLVEQPSTPALPVPSRDAPLLGERLPLRPMPATTKALLHLLTRAKKGQPIESYVSRSEAEQAVIASLVSCGWSLPAIAEAFRTFRPGHYSELASERERRRYLLRSVSLPLRRRDSEGSWSALARQTLTTLAEQAREAPWPGRTGSTDYKVYQALLVHFLRLGTLEGRVSCRDLAELSGLDWRVCRRSRKRLIRQKRIKQTALHTSTEGAGFRVLLPDFFTIGAAEFPESLEAMHYPELWTRNRLSGRSREVFERLASTPRKADELAVLVGCHKVTVHRALSRLKAAGLATATADGWVRGPAPLVDVAAEYEALQAAEKRRAQHLRDRAAWARERAIYAGYLSRREPELQKDTINTLGGVGAVAGSGGVLGFGFDFSALRSGLDPSTVPRTPNFSFRNDFALPLEDSGGLTEPANDTG